MSIRKVDGFILLIVAAGVTLGAVVGWVLVLQVVPEAASYRPAVLSTLLIPLGCFVGWVLSPSREGPATATLVCFALYLLSAFAAARLGTFFPQWGYHQTVLGVQVLGGLGVALFLAGSGRALPQVERLAAAGDLSGLVALLRSADPRTRREAVRALDRFGSRKDRHLVLQGLRQGLKDADLGVRRPAAAALVGRATMADLPLLVDALSDPDRRVRRQSLAALRWIEGDASRRALADHWRRTLSQRGKAFWGWSAPLLLGAAVALLGLLLPWEVLAGERHLVWELGGGAIVALLFLLSVLLAPAELLWGWIRRNLNGHLQRLRIWVYAPLAVLGLSLLWPLQAAAGLAASDRSGLGIGFWVALAGVLVQLLGSFFLPG